ncbi:hypothetical protein Q0590_30910 [Rhodocytophaga aerolata]|uniref:Transposase n=1 Tax=Rhodocytophaga aerolata TaxID=455078 RepID=A0ABT8RFG7_9BACT|nr:hypothetical protein [Rhodocytophaga aerolata]MDO1450724.1 hypothetical protein [Rhodocytophaga aerolata]
MKHQKAEKVKFYVDLPNTFNNKYLVYKVYDLDHSLDLLGRFANKNYQIRKAYHQFENGKSITILPEAIEQARQCCFYQLRKNIKKAFQVLEEKAACSKQEMEKIAKLHQQVFENNLLLEKLRAERIILIERYSKTQD